MRPPQNTPQPLRGGVETPNVALIKDDFIVHYNPKVTIETVDMGNGVLWTTSNITRDANGNYKLADNPWDYGCYFSWGDIVGHNSTEYNDGYSFSSRNYSSGASGNGYSLAGDIPSGDPTYDAATATLGGNWRIPTFSEMNYLTNSCNPTRTTLNGVNGIMFTNPNDPSKTLFFPEPGYYNGEEFFDSGNVGAYWTSIKYYSNSNCAYVLKVGNFYGSGMNFNGRWSGLSVRAVKSV